MVLKNSVLIVENLQIDYCTGGAMEVPNGEEILPMVNQLMPQFDKVVASVDWHPANHLSFAGNHPWRLVGQTMTIDGLAQELFPFHCVADSFGAKFYPGFEQAKVDLIVQKGTVAKVDDHSAFYDKAKQSTTPLLAFLEEHSIKNVFLVGLPLETAILRTAIDALSEGLQTFVITDACKAWNKTGNDEKRIWKNLEKAGVTLIDVSRINQLTTATL